MMYNIKSRYILVTFLLLFTFCSPNEDYYVGSSKSNKYHYTSCRWAQKIKSSNLVKFHTLEETRNARYYACKVCEPPGNGLEKNKNR